MKEISKISLRKKGWSEEDIEHAKKIIDKAYLKKDKKIRLLDKTIYFFVLFVLILGNMIISITLVPFLLVLNGLSLYASLIIIALSFGLLFDLLIRDIDDLTKERYILAGVLIPFVSLINVFYMALFSNFLSEKINLHSRHHPIVVGIVYTFFFILPHIIYKKSLKSKIKKK